MINMNEARDRSPCGARAGDLKSKKQTYQTQKCTHEEKLQEGKELEGIPWSQLKGGEYSFTMANIKDCNRAEKPDVPGILVLLLVSYSFVFCQMNSDKMVEYSIENGQLIS